MKEFVLPLTFFRLRNQALLHVPRLLLKGRAGGDWQFKGQGEMIRTFQKAWMILLLTGVQMALAHPARAVPVELNMRTEVRHYAVSGGNELTLLRQMRRKGPRVGGKPALASTRMRARYTAHLRKRGASCRVRDMRMNVTFTMILPRLRTSRAAMPRRWPAFTRRLRQHEQQHIRIWKDCLRQVRRQLPGLRARSCNGLKRRMRAVYRQIMDQCSRRHDKFDRREKHAAASLPFIKAAFGQARKSKRRKH